MLYLIKDELLKSFLEESDVLLSGMNAALNGFVEGNETHVFEDYAQQIDRMMGAANTLNHPEIGYLCKLGKDIGYKASQINEVNKLLVVHSLLGQLARILEAILKSIGKGEPPDFTDSKSLKIKLEKANADLGDLRVTVST